MNELVTTPLGTPSGSLSNSQVHSYLYSPQATHNLKYSFINSEFMDFSDERTAFSYSKGFSGFSHYSATNFNSFRNLTSTPVRSTPHSLPKSLPIDWNLFNKQYILKKKVKHSKLKKEPSIENNFENLPFQIIDFIADCVEFQSDLVSLSQTCQFFNKMVNKRLYKKILIIDNVDPKFKHYESNYTLLDLQKGYPKLMASLHSNTDELLPLIHEIVIDTTCTARTNVSYDLLNYNIYETLYDLFLTNDNNLKILDNMDFNNLKKFGSLLKYNRDHLIKHNYNKYTYHYSNTENLNELIQRDLLNLKNFQILTLKELNDLPTSCESLSVFIEHQYQLESDSNQLLELQPSTYLVLKNLKYLQLNTSITTETFINELSSSKFLPNLHLSSLETLSISNIHHNVNRPISFLKLNQIIDLNNLKNLELKFNCHEKVTCNSCILQFFTLWFNQIGVPTNLQKLSLISLPPSSQYNYDIQWDTVLISPYINQLLSSVKTFFINLNDFPFIPIFIKTPLYQLADATTLKLPINNTILERRKEMFDNILKSLVHCENLTIVDWFYNWLVYLRIPEISLDSNDDSGLNFLNYINSCVCEDCQTGRQVLQNLVKLTCFKDFKKRFRTDLHYQNAEKEEITPYNMIKSNPDEFRILYNHIIGSLKNRIPLDTQSSKISTSLKLDKFKQINELSTQLISKDQWNSIIKLFCHSMRDQLKEIIITLPHLKYLNLGGLVFKIMRDMNLGEVHVSNDVAGVMKLQKLVH